MIVVIFCMIGLVAYLLGSIPFSYWIARFGCGIDLKKVGSGNVGATNVLRSCGTNWGLLAYFLDIFKGVVAAVWIEMAWKQWGILDGEGYGQEIEPFVLLFYLLPTLGNIASIFMGFRGGKGVAVSTGVFLWLTPVPLLIVVALFLVFVWITGMVSFSSLAASLSYIVVMGIRLVYPFLFGWIFSFQGYWEERHGLWIWIASIVVTFFIILRHRENLKRMIPW